MTCGPRPLPCEKSSRESDFISSSYLRMNSYDDLREVITNVLVAEHARCLDCTDDLLAVRDHLTSTLCQTFTWQRGTQSNPASGNSGAGERRPRWAAFR